MLPSISSFPIHLAMPTSEKLSPLNRKQDKSNSRSAMFIWWQTGTKHKRNRNGWQNMFWSCPNIFVLFRHLFGLSHALQGRNFYPHTSSHSSDQNCAFTVSESSGRTPLQCFFFPSKLTLEILNHEHPLDICCEIARSVFKHTHKLSRIPRGLP